MSRSEQLARLVRELLLAGHLIDRAGMPQVLAEHGPDAMRDVAIDEWMGASPIYTRRMQRLLGFQGDDVETIFKGMQLDVGAPPQFMDFRYSLHGPLHGEFWLDSCGALLDVEPMGDELVVAMCHHVEDPTFDATACATNPRARMRPVHRPPRRPLDRHPHCRWTVEIDPDTDPLPEPEQAVLIARTAAACLPLPIVASAFGVDHGRTDYGGPLEADLDLESFAPEVLEAVAEEVCLQGQLLALSFSAAVTVRFGDGAALDLGARQLVGVAGLVAERLAKAFEVGASLDGVAAVLAMHPALRPRSYVDLRLARTGDELRVELGRCPALGEEVARSWPMLLTDPDVGARVLGAIAGAVDPTARCEPVEGSAMTWVVTSGHDPRPEPDEVLLTRFSTGADFTFRPR